MFSEVFGTDYPSETDTGSWLHVVSFSHGSSTGLFAVAKMRDLVMQGMYIKRREHRSLVYVWL